MLNIDKEKIEKHIKNISGFKIGDTHFKIGSKIHATSFYYAKRLFQNSFYTSRIALQLAKEILNREHIKQNDEITLVGYEMYSELLLSLIKKFLRENAYKPFDDNNVNHFIVYDNGKELDHLPKFNLNKEGKEKSKIIVVVPIASTGSTALKIRNYCFDQLKLTENSDIVYYNVLIVQPDEYPGIEITGKTFKSGFAEEIPQNFLIKLSPDWKKPETCDMCFPIHPLEGESKPLYETDKSALTPAIVFNYPNPRKIEFDDIYRFSKIKFTEALNYKPHKRNGEHFLFSIDPEKLIENNKKEVKDWLEDVVKGAKDNKLFKKTNDKILIISPCHHSNTTFINLVNDIIFNSSATIIHYQSDIDYLPNFKLMNEGLITSADKIVFVDDSLKSGKTFFSVYDIVRFSTGYDEDLNPGESRFAAAIFLSNKSSVDTNNRVKRAAKNVFAFNNVHFPNALKLHDKKPLEHEELRYKALSNFALHDTIKQEFDSKYKKLCGNVKEQTNGDNKQLNHLAMFKATHAIYKYFSGDEKKELNLIFDDFLRELDLEKDSGLFSLKNKKNEIKMAVMKVLSQYPFLLYKPLKDRAYQWHQQWIKKFYNTWNRDLSQFSYDDFRELKFLIRRSVFFGNNFISTKDFIEFIIKIYQSGIKNEKIKKYRKKNESKTDQISIDEEVEEFFEEKPFNEAQQTNINDFHLYIVSNYLELMYKNPWVSVKLFEAVDSIKTDNKSAQQFIRMLKIEAAAVVENFYDLIIKDNEKGWEEVYGLNNIDKIIEANQPIETFIAKYNATQKKEITDKILCDSKDKLFEFLLIRHFILTDKNKKQKKDININEKTDYIFRHIKKHFNTIPGVFFIVTDGKGDPHLVFDENENEQAEIVEYSKENDKNNPLISDFLKGENADNSEKEENVEVLEIEVDFQNSLEEGSSGKPNGDSNENDIKAKKTIIEYYKEEPEEQEWKDLYSVTDSDETKKSSILNGYKYIMLIRISNNDDRNITQGIMGFYNNTGFDNELQAKQLLMLLRKDLSGFITTHHKNEAFSLWREAEQTKRFAYLAGHGRDMLRDIGNNKEYESLHEYSKIIDTMETIQYLIATETRNKGEKVKKLKKSFKDSFFATKISKNQLQKIFEMGKHIYEISDVDNKVYLKESEPDINIPDDYEFQFSEDILRFICFELFVNAKKNRFHFINECTQCKKNELEFSAKIDTDKLEIKITNTCPLVKQETLEKLRGTNDTPIKPLYETSGTKLINEVLKIFNSDDKHNSSTLFFEKPVEICYGCGMYKLTAVLQIKPYE